jgi:hypothetical protein
MHDRKPAACGQGQNRGEIADDEVGAPAVQQVVPGSRQSKKPRLLVEAVANEQIGVAGDPEARQVRARRYVAQRRLDGGQAQGLEQRRCGLGGPQRQTDVEPTLAQGGGRRAAWPKPSPPSCPRRTLGIPSPLAGVTEASNVMTL